MKNKFLFNLNFLYFFILFFLFLNYTIPNLEPRYENQNLEIENYKSCSMNVRQVKKQTNFEILEVRKTISVVPEISNLNCLGKVINFDRVNKEQLIANVAVSFRFSSFVENVSFIIFLIIPGFIKKNNILYFTNSIFTLVVFNTIFMINNSLNLILIKIALILFTYLGLNSLNDYSKEIKRIKFRTDINSLRAIAVLSVIFYHAKLLNFSGGWLGVDIFFVISGYLISNIIFSEIFNHNFSFTKFYERRIKRIFPALYFMLVVTFPLAYIFLTPKGMVEYLNTMKYSLIFLSNNYLKDVNLYTAEPNKFSPLLHTWSLSVEEQYYLIFPIFIYLIYKYKKSNKYLLLAFFISIGINLLNFKHTLIFYLIPFRVWELLLGVIIMILNSKKTFFTSKYFELLGLTLIFFSVLFFDDSYINYLAPKILCLSGVFFLLINLNENRYLDKLSKFYYFNLIGLISYSLYLYHQPIYAFLRIYLYRNNYKFTYLYHVLSLSLIFIFSLCSYLFVERVFIKSFSIQKKIILALTGTLTLVIIYFGTVDLGYANRFADIPEKVKKYSIITQLYPGDGSLDDWSGYDCNSFPIAGYETIYENNIIGPCQYKKNGALNNFLLIGDSHANTLSVAITYYGEKFSDDFNFIPIHGTIGRCLLSAQNDVIDYRYDCTDAFFNSFLQNLKTNDVVAIIGRFPVWVGQIGNEQIQCSENCDHLLVLEKRLNLIASRVKKFIIIYPVPTHSYNIAESYFFRKNTWGTQVTSDYQKWRDISLASYSFLDNLQISNSEKIFTESLFCSEELNSCIASTQDTLYYADTNHLTIEGNILIVNELIKLVNE